MDSPFLNGAAQAGQCKAAAVRYREPDRIGFLPSNAKEDTVGQTQIPG